MTGWFWFAFFLIIVGIALSWYVAIKALNSSFSKDEEHGLFWGGTVCLTAGIIIMMYILFSYASKNSKLMKQVYELNMKYMNLQESCGRGGSGGSSGPGFFSRLGSRIKGFFKTPSAGSPQQ